MPFSDPLNYPLGQCHPDGHHFGQWVSRFSGYGCNSVEDLDGRRCHRLRPKASTHRDETHAGLILGPDVHGNMDLVCGVETSAQLRRGDAPNNWEVGWLCWYYTDDEHFYYFILKPEGWELGKRDPDPAYPGGQRFLATGNEPFPIQTRYELRVVQTNTTIQVYVDSQLIVTFTDQERPYTHGRIALYTEDADVYFDSVAILHP